MAHECGCGACGNHADGQEFRARLVRNSGSLGMLLAVHPKITGIGIVEVDEDNSESIQRWNEENPEHCIQGMYSILEVNGHREALAMANELQKAEVLDLLICRQLTEMQAWAVERALAKKKLSQDIDTVLIEAPPDHEEACSICHEGMTCEVVRLPCQHRFHGACVKKWLMQHQRCPLCNHQLEL